MYENENIRIRCLELVLQHRPNVPCDDAMDVAAKMAAMVLSREPAPKLPLGSQRKG